MAALHDKRTNIFVRDKVLIEAGDDNAMFIAAQIAQGTITSHQIAQASAALAESKRNPAIGAALQERDKDQRLVDQLYREIDNLSQMNERLLAEPIQQPASETTIDSP